MSWPPCATPRLISVDSPDTPTSPPPNATTAGHPTPPSTPSSLHDQLDRRRSAPFHDLAMPLAYPRRQLHVVVDNYATHKHPAVRAWLRRHPRVTLHFTPTSGSWLNLVEAFFSIITRQALRRGNFPTVADLIAAIERFIDAWNDR